LLHIALPAITEVLGHENHARELRPQFLDHLRRDDTLTYSVTFTATGIKELRPATRGEDLAEYVYPLRLPKLCNTSPNPLLERIDRQQSKIKGNDYEMQTKCDK
jgi:hypothetical protein